MFFNNLKIVGESPLKLNKIAKAVYSVLGQKTSLVAEVVFVSEEEIQTLNNEKRGIDKVTDVLSFPTLDGIRGSILSAKDYPYDCISKRLNIGSIAVCLEQCKRQAQEFGHSVERETSYLIVHGLLHLFGYDHMTDEDKLEMRTLEKKIVKILGLGDEL